MVSLGTNTELILCRKKAVSASVIIQLIILFTVLVLFIIIVL